jgi:hypothetical protein
MVDYLGRAQGKAYPQEQGESLNYEQMKAQLNLQLRLNLLVPYAGNAGKTQEMKHIHVSNRGLWVSLVPTRLG